MKAQLHSGSGLAVAEVDHQDLWQRSTLAGALVGGSRRQLDEAADSVGALAWTRASRRECGSSGASPRSTTWRV